MGANDLNDEMRRGTLDMNERMANTARWREAQDSGPAVIDEEVPELDLDEDQDDAPPPPDAPPPGMSPDAALDRLELALEAAREAIETVDPDRDVKIGALDAIRADQEMIAALAVAYVTDRGRLESLLARYDALPGQRSTARDFARMLRGIAAQNERKRRAEAAANAPKGSDNPSKAVLAVELAIGSGAEPWHDLDGEAYLDVPADDGGRQTMRVGARPMRQWLSGLVYAYDGSALGGQGSNDACDILAAQARAEGEQHDVHVRVAAHDGAIYVDLGDETWRAIRVTRHGWDIMHAPPVRFRRPNGMRPMHVPIRNTVGWDRLKELIRFASEQDRILVIAWLIGLLHPGGGPYPILALAGEHGSSKSSTGVALRSILDPNKAPLRSPPREDKDIMIAAENSHVLGYDNLSHIPVWMADGLCRIATGGGFSSRELYTNADEVVLDARRPILMTSIEDVAGRADLADRTITVHLSPIPADERKTERELMVLFEEVAPRVLGCLLDAAVVGLQRYDDLKLERLPRMADFAAWVAACEAGLPWDDGAFLKTYETAREATVEASIEADVVATAILTLLGSLKPDAHHQRRWTGNCAGLLAELNRRRGDAHPPTDWPGTARKMSGCLTRAAPLLRERCCEVEMIDSSKRIYELRMSAATMSTYHGD